MMSTTGTSSPSMWMVMSPILRSPLGLWSSARGTALPNGLLVYSSYWLGGTYEPSGCCCPRYCACGDGAPYGFFGGGATGVFCFLRLGVGRHPCYREPPTPPDSPSL